MVADTLNQEFRINCSACGHACSIAAQELLAGHGVDCPICGARVVVPVTKVAEQPPRPQTEANPPGRGKAPTGRLSSTRPNTLASTLRAPVAGSFTTSAPAAANNDLERPDSVTVKRTPKTEPTTTAVPKEPIKKPLGQTLVPVSPEDDADEAAASEDTGAESDERRSRRRRSSSRSSRRSSSEKSWNEIGVDGLPIREPGESENEEATSVETRPQDVLVLLVAFTFSLLLTQAGLWWVAGVDPLGIAPWVPSWASWLVPSGLRP